jgi:hypothetical protein
MEFLLSLPKILVDLCVNLLKIKKDDRTKQRLADLLSQVADCISKISDNVFEGVHDSEVCGELDIYIAHLHKLVEKETNEETAKQLTFWLKNVAEVPGYCQIQYGKVIVHEAKPSTNSELRFQQGCDIRNIAGIIRGLSNLMRV